MRHLFDNASGRGFDDLRLGDIVTLPDGRSFSLRMLAELPDNKLAFDALLVLGDLDLVLAPSSATRTVQILVPVESLPASAASARSLCDGASAFWAPHLPAVGGAMGEILFRLLLLRASFSPLVVLDRSGDQVFFLKVGELDPARLVVTRMPASAFDDLPVARYAGVVEPSPLPSHDRPRPLPVPSRRAARPVRRSS